MRCFLTSLFTLLLQPCLSASWSTSVDLQFLENHCYDCHDEDTSKGSLNLVHLPKDLNSTSNHQKWVYIYDRIEKGEMPPKNKKQPSPEERNAFLQQLAQNLSNVELSRIQKYGRTVQRRLNRHEYENAVRDLLEAPWLQIKSKLPEDRERNLFNKSGETLDISHVQMARYLQVAENALRQMMVKELARPTPLSKRFYARDQASMNRRVYYNPFNRSPERATFPLIDYQADIAVLEKKAPMTVGPENPEIREKEAFGVVASSYEPIEIHFSSFKAPVSGHYKLRFKAYTFWAGPESEKRWWRPSRHETSIGRTLEPVSIYGKRPPRILRKLLTFDVKPEPSVQEFEVLLLKGESIQPDAVRLFRSRPPGWHNPLAEKDGQPGVAFHWMEVDGPILKSWPPEGHKLLFGDLPLKKNAAGIIQVNSSSPQEDSRKLLKNFLIKAYRKPVTFEDPKPFLELIDKALEQGLPFQDAMIAAYTAVLCSPGFVTLKEDPGDLNQHALASRLSFFLTNSSPDAKLRDLADQQQLGSRIALKRETERLLDSPQSQRFLDAFLDYWLDLKNIQATSPHEKLYPDYYLDDYLVESAKGETRLFFEELIKNDLPVRNLIKSDFAFLNQKLANHYNIPDVTGAHLRIVSLQKYPKTPRGGLLTQASILKVTANGARTSPVTRGTWINERLLGTPPPPPPPSVPAIDSDTRGATTIRELLKKHRADPSCNSCHEKIDPVGFALESFDILGGWRKKYRTLEGNGPTPEGFGHNGQRFTYKMTQDVDPHGQLPDGRAFKNIKDLQNHLLKDEKQLARNLVHQFITYATGTPPLFSDRPHIEKCLENTKSSNYGVRSLIHAVVQSPIFQMK